MADVKRINGYDINDEASRTNIGCTADTYDSSKTYAIDDIVVYKKKIYKCKTAITAPEAFDSEKWEQICLRDLIMYLNTKKQDVLTAGDNITIENGIISSTGGGTGGGSGESGGIVIENGEWTPEIGCVNEPAPTVTYTYQRGSYMKIGNLVFLKFSIRGKITALNGTNNYATVTNLPFLADMEDRIYTSLVISDVYDVLTSDENVMFKVNQDCIRLQTKYGAYAGVFKISSKNFDISASGWYKVVENTSE
jgi:hypothetical protein